MTSTTLSHRSVLDDTMSVMMITMIVVMLRDAAAAAANDVDDGVMAIIVGLQRLIQT